MNPRDFVKMCEGFNLRHKREQRLWLEQMKMWRWIGGILYNSNTAAHNRVKDLQKLYALPEPEEDKPKRILRLPTPEEMAEMASWPAPRPLGDGKTLMEIVKEYKAKEMNHE